MGLQGFTWVYMGLHGFSEVVITSNLGDPVGWLVGWVRFQEVSGGYNLQNLAWTFADDYAGCCMHLQGTGALVTWHGEPFVPSFTLDVAVCCCGGSWVMACASHKVCVRHFCTMLGLWLH